MRFGRVSSDGKATSLSNTSIAVARLGRLTGRRSLAVPVEAHDPTFSRHRVHEAKPVLVRRRVELGAQGAKAARLLLDELAIRTNQIDHERVERHLQPVTRLRQYRLDRSMQRPLRSPRCSTRRTG